RSGAADNFQPTVGSILCGGARDRDAWREIVDAEDTRDSAAAMGAPSAATGHRPKPKAAPGLGARLPGAGTPRWPELAPAGWVGRCAPRGAAVPAAAGCAVRPAPDAGLDRGSPGSPAAERDAGAAVGGI